MRIVDIDQAKTQLTRLVAEAAKGESFVMAIEGKPVVKVVAVETPAAVTGRRLGFMKGKISSPEDFDRLGSAEIETTFSRGG